MVETGAQACTGWLEQAWSYGSKLGVGAAAAEHEPGPPASCRLWMVHPGTLVGSPGAGNTQQRVEELGSSLPLLCSPLLLPGIRESWVKAAVYVLFTCSMTYKCDDNVMWFCHSL